MTKLMNMKFWSIAAVVSGLMMTGPLQRDTAAATFNSGSNCAIFNNSTTCPFSPTVNTTVVLPPDGILHHSTFNIPRGVTVTFQKNARNTPVNILASGDVTIYGTIVLNGTSATHSGTAGSGNFGDDGQPGIGGPGGFDGGYGGFSALFGGAAGLAGGAGKGPGGGQSAAGMYNTDWGGYGGGGGGFGSAGGTGGWAAYTAGGATYGQSSLLPLLGGSGGGGGSAGGSFNGAGGGGGGGGITIASSGTIYLGYNNWQGGCYISNGGICNGITGGSWGSYGRIYADGGAGGSNAGNGQGGAGGGGSGGAIRLVANTIVRGDEGYLQAVGGGGGGSNSGGGAGGNGWIRIEGNTSNWVGNTNPGYSFGLPGHALVPDNPTLSIVSVTPTNGTNSGVTANTPANPSGNADITFPTGTSSATVSLAATNIPLGTTVTVYVVPATGAARSSTLSDALSGSLAAATATATVTLSPGNNVLMAAATYTVTEIIAMNLPKFNGEYVAKIRVEGGMDGKSKVTYITASGKEYPADKAKV